MFDIFTNSGSKRDARIRESIRDYLNSQLPAGYYSIIDDNNMSIVQEAGVMSFPFDINDMIDDNLSVVDKKHLIDNVIIPTLKHYDKGLEARHKEILRILKTLSSH